MAEPDDGAAVAAILGPLDILLDAMQAARDANDFIESNAQALQDVEALFVAEAVRMFPGVSRQQHVAAGSLVHRTVHEAMDGVSELQASGGSADEQEALRTAAFDRLRAEMLKLTGQPQDYTRYAAVWNRSQARPSRTRLLRSSMLMGAVSDFEVFISAVVRAQIRLRPGILNQDEQTYSLRDIEAFDTLEAFKESAAERMADGLLRGGFDKWMEWFQKRHGLTIVGVTDSPLPLVEVFQRRHLLVHNGGVVNSVYLAKTSGKPDLPELGTVLHVSLKYFNDALDLLTVAAVKLAGEVVLQLAGRTPGGREEIDHRVSHLGYELLQARHYNVVEQITSWHLEWVGDQSYRLIAMVNNWVAKKEIHGVERIRADVECWDTKPLAAMYKLVQLALLDQVEEAHVVLKRLLASGEIDHQAWRSWPVLDGLRAYDESQTLEPVDQDPSLVEGSHGPRLVRLLERIEANVAHSGETVDNHVGGVPD